MDHSDNAFQRPVTRIAQLVPAGVAWRRVTCSAVAALAMFCAVGCTHAINPAVIEDAQLAARVKTALVNDPELGPRAIEVRVRAGVVHLSGRVLLETEAQRLVELVRSVSGVREVRSEVRVGTAPAGVARRRPPAGEGETMEAPGDPRLFAVGGSVSWANPRAATLGGGATIGPLVRFGSGSGLALAVDFNWFTTELHAGAERTRSLSRLRVRPIMGGAGYTMATDRVSIAFSLVGGVSFNSLGLEEAVVGDLVPLEADNGFAWRPGVSIWVDPSRRLALNFFAGYLVARPSVRWLEDGRLTKRSLRADTVLVSTGVAYKLF